VFTLGVGADRVGLVHDQWVGGSLEHVEERTFHWRRDRRHGRNLHNAFQETAENVPRTQS